MLGTSAFRSEELRKLPKRMVETGGLAKKDRITHRIELTSIQQINAEAKEWLKAAYDLDI